MRTSLKTLFLAAVTLGVFAGTPLFAATFPITVVNSGFESPVLGVGASSSAVSGWSPFGDVGFFGAWNPDAAFYANGAPENRNIGDVFFSPAFSGCSQVLQGAEGQFQADTTYELRVKVGRNLLDTFDGYLIQLVANGVIIAQDDNSRAPAAGTFVASTVKYTYNAALHSGLVGYPLEIRLLTKGLGGGSGDVNFDEVQLTYETSNPVANHGGPYRVSQGGPLSLNGNNSVPSSGGSSITLYEWDLNSNDNGGAFNADITGASPAAIPYATLTGSYGMAFGENTIRLRITDNLAQTVVGTTTVTIYPLYTYIGPNTSRGQDERWNKTASWDTATVPSGLVDILIPASKNPVPVISSTTPSYTGNLTIGSNSQLSMGWTTSGAPVYNSLGTPGKTIITMDSGSSINIRVGGTPIIPALALTGDASVTLGSSTQTGAQASFNHPITGSHRLTLYGNNRTNCVANLNTPNTFNEIYTAGVPYADGGVTISGNAPGSFGAGNITLTALSGGGNSGVVVINVENSMADSATLSMDGDTSPKITMNANDTISKLVINGAQLPAGTYGGPSSSATYKQTWMAGTAVLTVTDGKGSYWDTNGATAGAGGTSPNGTWDSGITSWSSSITGTTATGPWIDGGTAVFSAGSDATGSYTVNLGDRNAITVTNSFTASANTATTSFNVTKTGWALSGGNCVAVLVSGLNATGFTATYAGQAMTVQGVSETRNSYVGIAYIIGDALPATGNVVINVPYVKPAINTGAYGNMGTVYSILSLSGVASAGTPVTKVLLSNPPVTSSLTYSTSVNNSFVLGVVSDSNWQNQLKTVVGTCSEVITTAKPAYFNTLHCYGSVGAAGSYTDVYSNRPTALITLPFNAKTTANPLLAGAGQKIGGLGFEEGAVTLSGSKLELQTNSPVTSASGITGTIASQISGLSSAGLVKKGPGTVIISNNTNNYPGATSVLNGTLRLGASNALPSTAVTLAGDAPGAIANLDLNGFNNAVAGLAFGGSSSTSGSSVSTGAGTLTLGGNVEFNSENSPLGATLGGNLSLGSSTRTFRIRDSFSAVNDLDVSAIISGTGGLEKIGLGTLQLSGNNTYTGVTTVNNGLLALSGSNAAATGGITVNNSGAIRFDSPASINGTGENVTINSGGLASFGPTFGAANIPAALADRIDPASSGVVAVDNYGSTNFNFASSGLDVYLGALGDITYTGLFSPNGAYRLGGGGGTITLSGANALTGGGSLLVGGSVIIANSNNLSGATTISSEGRLQIGEGGTAGSLSSTSLTNDGILAFNRSDTFTQGANFWSSISGDGAVEQAGSGVLVLNANNSYSGGTNLVAGTLRLGHANAIGSGSLIIYSGTLDVTGPGPLTLTSGNPVIIGGNFVFGGTANLNMGNGNVSSFASPVITLNGTGSTLTFGGAMTNISGGDQSITVNGSGNTLVLGGFEMSSDVFASNIAITIGGTGNVAITGPVEDWSLDQFDIRLGSLTKTGTGTLTLSASNNYTGNTLVSAGVLHLASGSQVSPISVDSGGILAFTLNSTIDSNKKLTLNAGHKIRIIGTVNTSVPFYTLMNASSIAGDLPTLETPIDGYFLEIAGNSLNLTKIDSTPPVLSGADIVDDQGGGPIAPNIMVTYTISFNEDIDAGTVTSADFSNAGTSSITIGTITETDPGVFTVQITPTTVGTLQLSIPPTADIRDPADNVLESDPAIVDDTIISVAVPSNDWLLGTDIIDDQFGGTVSVNTLVTYILYFDRDIDDSTVNPADFNNAGSSSITIGTIMEIDPGVFVVEVTPTTVGTLQLRIPTTADIRDLADNIMDNDPAILDDTTIVVADPYGLWADGAAFGVDANGDGVANGLAWLLGASNVDEDARALLPTIQVTSGDLYLYFFTLNTASRGTASVKVQYSKDLGIADPWVTHQAEVPDTSGTVNGIEFLIEPSDENFISVRARISASAATPGGKLFARVRGAETP